MGFSIALTMYVMCTVNNPVTNIFTHLFQPVWKKQLTCFIMLDNLKPFGWSDLKVTYQYISWGLNSRHTVKCGMRQAKYAEMLQLANGITEFVCNANIHSALFKQLSFIYVCLFCYIKCSVGSMIGSSILVFSTAPNSECWFVLVLFWFLYLYITNIPITE